MAHGKMLVLGNVLKLNRPFKAATITQMSGLSRQLVYIHLNNLCETGYLEKIDKSYIIRDREGLLTTLIEESDNPGTSKPEAGGFFSKERIDTWTGQAEMIIASRTLGLPMSLDARQGMVDKIDDSVRVLKHLRKYLTNATKTTGSAQKFLKDMGDGDVVEEAIWKLLVAYAGDSIVVDLPEFRDKFKDAMVEE